MRHRVLCYRGLKDIIEYIDKTALVKYIISIKNVTAPCWEMVPVANGAYINLQTTEFP